MRTVQRLIPLAMCCCAMAASAQQPSALDAAAWQADLATLARELPQRHVSPFTVISRARWDSAVASLDTRLPGLTRHQIVVELMRLVALLGDAHSIVEPAPAVPFAITPSSGTVSTTASTCAARQRQCEP
jgi:hypothetical protein